LRADTDLLAALLFFAAALACRDKALDETDVVGSFFSALILALDLVRETGACVFPFSVSRCAFFFNAASPVFGGGNFTPARLASDKPMAMACFADRAPCLPFLIFFISSCTNSPAWVPGDFPLALSRLAFFIVDLSGIVLIFNCNSNKYASPASFLSTLHRVGIKARELFRQHFGGNLWSGHHYHRPFDIMLKRDRANSALWKLVELTQCDISWSVKDWLLK
jgi:hypothetical protein